QNVAILGVQQVDTTRFCNSGAAGRSSNIRFDDEVLSCPLVALEFQVTEAVKIRAPEQVDGLFQHGIVSYLFTQATGPGLWRPLPKLARDECDQGLRGSIEIAVAGIERGIAAFDPFLNHEQLRPVGAPVVA